ncbi:DUF1488 family protein [Noviherbaspirillum aerium]|uniref:DUF1488 family protein n=1 Tax=Noviherbaspirillum aerium TaxID=2588497 RepID=UPI00124E95B4|nr:DUF1488 family protein [Noviherbaspirillum aerium]
MDNTTPSRPAEDSVIFTINIDAKDRECTISREALNTLSELKNIDSSDADTLELFKAFETFIRPVAQSLFGGKALHAPLQLTPENMNAAYRSKIGFQSAMPATASISRAENKKGMRG